MLVPSSIIQLAFLCLTVGSSKLVSTAAVKRSVQPETAGVQPIPCHSHNDYLRDHPLIDALHNGCTSVEADIWQKDDMKDDLRVGHTKGSLKDDRTLKSLYITPIIQRLQGVNAARPSSPTPDAAWNGLFLTKPSQSLVLLIDFKTAGDATWSTLMAALQPLRDGGWLSYWDIQKDTFYPGAITLVASGDATFDQINKNTVSTGNIVRRDVFLDAPLPQVGTSNDYSKKNSFYASTDYAKDSGGVIVKNQIDAANKIHLISRYFNTPDKVGSPQQRVLWQDLYRDGVGIFNTDHLTTFKNWWEKQQKS